MSERSHEILRPKEEQRPRDPDQTVPDLGRIAIDGAQRQERKDRVAPPLGRLAVDKTRTAEPPREERGR